MEHHLNESMEKYKNDIGKFAMNNQQLPHFHVFFWLSHIYIYLFYLCPSFCPS